MGFTLSFYPHQSCTANSLTFNLLFYGKVHSKSQTPKNLVDTCSPAMQPKGRGQQIHRSIFMHTATGGIVEVLMSSRYLIGDEYMQLPFCEKSPGSGLYHYTAVLLNTPHSISAENGLKAMEEVAKWYTKLSKELESITSREWTDYPVSR